MADPLLAQALKGVNLQKFSGKSEDLEDFERKWNQYLMLMQEGKGGRPLNNTMVLLTLKNFLDPSSASILESQYRLNPNVSYHTFLRELRQIHKQDGQRNHHQKWKGCKLKCKGIMPNSQEWGEYQANYLSLRGMVDSYTEQEDFDNVFRNVPAQYRVKVNDEMEKRRRNQYWVRVLVPNGLDPLSVKNGIENMIGRVFPKFTMDRHQIVIQLDNNRDQLALCEWSGSIVLGHAIKMDVAEYFMTGDEVLEFVRLLLVKEENLQRLVDAVTPTPPPPTPQPLDLGSTGREEGGIFAVSGAPGTTGGSHRPRTPPSQGPPPYQAAEGGRSGYQGGRRGGKYNYGDRNFDADKWGNFREGGGGRDNFGKGGKGKGERGKGGQKGGKGGRVYQTLDGREYQNFRGRAWEAPPPPPTIPSPARQSNPPRPGSPGHVTPEIYCFNCKSQGREFNHDTNTCPHVIESKARREERGETPLRSRPSSSTRPS